ncbi:UNVERIFIED_CONTAM: hypothetical protein PYX00_009897 [Menopon gallinae]|uniref:ZP domain-containing protein n=1 Tax=Menopon gallinae TaxID=328185 RepID=A0AAW2HCR3_9NEOP
MKVDLVRTEDMKQIYLNQLKTYPDKECHPQTDGNRVTFNLSLRDIHRCGVTRVSDKARNKMVYYHRIIVERESEQPEKESILVKCVVTVKESNHTLTRRNVLPAGFQEPEDLEITTSLTERAPEPILNVGVRQGKERVTGEVNVNPGTPLTMEIYLDESSAPVYGILVSYMQVTDTKQQEETIIFNGCSVDTYLFENFNTIDGDFLSAKFRAFKFPDSTYVQFKGTVNVCLDKCRGVQCSNGQIGYGRRRRSVPEMPPDPNKLFEVSLTTFIKINFNDKTTEELKSEELITRTKNSTKNLLILEEEHTKETEDKVEPQVMLGTAENGVDDSMNNRRLKQASEIIKEEYKVSVIEEGTNAAHPGLPNLTALAVAVLVCLFRPRP